MKLQKLNIEAFSKFQLEHPNQILGGGTCVDTCCSGPHGYCDDYHEDVSSDMPQM